MKKTITLLLALCLLLSMLPVGALAAYDRTKPLCQAPGHEKDDGVDHYRPRTCWVKGHFNCDGMDHEKAACNQHRHVNCDGKDHSPAPCGVEGHYACKGKHEAAVCGAEGHYACSGKHSTKVNPYCAEQHTTCQATEEHYCDPQNGGCGETYLCKDSNKHTACKMCGLLWCDESLGKHSSPCGHDSHRICYYKQQGKVWRSDEHPICHLCGKGKCVGRHGVGACVDYCTQCGEPLIDEYTHRTECGEHYKCVTKGLDHGWCDKHYMPKCRPNHPKH